VNWQAYRDCGDTIYEMRDIGPSLLLTKTKRVIHSASQLNPGTKLRYKTRWHPLHEATELRVRYLGQEGLRKPVLLNWLRLTRDDKRLPFVCAWETGGSYYQTFGY
jgi:hypothetical protein